MVRDRNIRAIASVPAFACVFALSVALRYGELPGPVSWATFAWLTLIAVAIKVVVFWRVGIFRIRVRHLSFDDLISIGKAVSVSSLLFGMAAFFAYVGKPLSRGVWLLDWGATLLAISAIACGRRWVADYGHRRVFDLGRRADSVPVLIGGTGHIAEGLLHAIRRDIKSKYRVVGFLAPSKRGMGMTIGGLPVVGMLEHAAAIAEEYGVGEIVINAGDLSGQAVRKLINDVRDRDVKVTVLPAFEKMLAGDVAMQPRDVEIEDLLGREPVSLDAEAIEDWLAGRTVMVTGSSGSIGSEVCRQLIPFSPQRLVLVDQSESGQFFLERELVELAKRSGAQIEFSTRIADISDAGRMSSLFRAEKPEVLFHAAAYKHVPLMELNPGEAVKVNIQGTRLLADLSHQHSLESFVMVSTDKAVNPTSLMGATKRVAELYVQGLASRSKTRFVTVRFGNVLGSNGSVVPIFKQQIADGGPVTVTHPEMVRYFMTIPEASQLIIQAGGQGNGGDVFVLDMGEPVKIVDLACDLIRLSGLTLGEDIEIVFTGTRPGEKLYEELYLDGEQRLPTAHPKILAASSEQVVMGELRDAINELGHVAEGDLHEIEAIIKRLVPSFRTLAAPTEWEQRRAA